MEACASAEWEMVEAFIESGSNLEGRSQVHVQFCIQNRYFIIDVEFIQDGKTPFLYACIKGNMKIVKLLMRKEAKVSVSDHVRK